MAAAVLWSCLYATHVVATSKHRPFLHLFLHLSFCIHSVPFLARLATCPAVRVGLSVRCCFHSDEKSCLLVAFRFLLRCLFILRAPLIASQPPQPKPLATSRWTLPASRRAATTNESSNDAVAAAAAEQQHLHLEEQLRLWRRTG